MRRVRASDVGAGAIAVGIQVDPVTFASSRGNENKANRSTI
jgi:hypothetical protein